MKILVVSDLPHFVTGGAETRTARLIGEWANRGHEVICLGRRMGKGPVSIGRHRIEVRRIATIQCMGRGLRGGSYLASLGWLLWRYRHWADVIYTLFLGEAAITVSVFKQFGLLQSILVACPAGGLDGGDIHFLSNVPGERWWKRLLDANCDAINLISPKIEEEVVGAGFSCPRMSRIPNGVPVGPLNRRPSEGPIRFVSVSRLVPQKGLDCLLSAVAALRDRLQPGQITIVGSGPEEASLKRQAAQLGVGHLIQWTGNLDQNEVKLHLEATNVFILPSRWEGFSNAALEAMERGLAPILTACGGVDTYVDSQIGWVISRNDSAALARAMVEALSLPRQQIYEMGMRGRALVQREFDIKVIADRYLDLFSSLRRPI